jgi:UPF0716 family protein affecting phage T7 exclusion
MTWGPGVTGPFFIVLGIFLLASAGGLFLLRRVMARTGEQSWKSLPGAGRFKTYAFQYRASVAAAVLVAVGGVISLIAGILNL